MKLTSGETARLSYYLEGFLYGLYSGIFVMYLQCHASKKDADKGSNTVLYALCLLYALSAPLVTLDLFATLIPQDIEHQSMWYHFYNIRSILFGCCDFIAQFILIYRCWIVWGRSIRVVIVPLFLAFAFLATWMTAVLAPQDIIQGEVSVPIWSNILVGAGLGISMTVNALVTGLIIFRLLKVFREVRAASNERMLGATGGVALRAIIFILIESGMALFSIQFARFVIVIVDRNKGLWEGYDLIGITPTFILVRVSMGLSFHDEDSMAEAAAESLRFVSPNNSNPNAILGNESPSIANQEDKDKYFDDELIYDSDPRDGSRDISV